MARVYPSVGFALHDKYQYTAVCSWWIARSGRNAVDLAIHSEPLRPTEYGFSVKYILEGMPPYTSTTGDRTFVCQGTATERIPAQAPACFMPGFGVQSA